MPITYLLSYNVGRLFDRFGLHVVHRTYRDYPPPPHPTLRSTHLLPTTPSSTHSTSRSRETFPVHSLPSTFPASGTTRQSFTKPTPNTATSSLALQSLPELSPSEHATPSRPFLTLPCPTAAHALTPFAIHHHHSNSDTITCSSSTLPCHTVSCHTSHSPAFPLRAGRILQQGDARTHAHHETREFISTSSSSRTLRS